MTDIPNGATLAVGGFGLCDIPSVLIDAILEVGTSDLEAVSNNCGVHDWGPGQLLMEKRLRRRYDDSGRVIVSSPPKETKSVVNSVRIAHVSDRPSHAWRPATDAS